MSKTVTSPSGMILSVRGMKAKEMVFLQDKKLAKNGQMIDKLLGACVEKIEDFGPYASTDSGILPPDSWLLGDKFFALLAIRSQTFGDDLTLNLDCENSDCKKPFDLKVKLEEFQLKSLSSEDASRFRAGELMTCKVPSTGALVKYRLATGKDEKLSSKAKDDENPAVAMLAGRIVEIEGVETQAQFSARALAAMQSSGKADRPQKFLGVREYLDELSMGDFYALVEAMEEHDCGVDTDIDASCPYCGNEQKARLQLGQNFWRPEKASKR